MSLMTRRRIMGVKESGAILPSEYQQVEYIGLPRDFQNAYLKTDIISSDVYRFEMGLSDIANDSTIVFKSLNGNNAFGTPYCGFGGHSLWNAHFTIERHENSYGYDWIATKKNTYDAGRLTLIGTWLDSNFGAQFNYHYVRMKDENDALLFDGVPCYRKTDGKVGMYDTVSRNFYSSSGSLDFKKGADV